MAAPLSILISDPNGCLTFQIFGLTVVSGQALQKPGMSSCGVCALGCSAFRGSDRFTVTRSVQKGRGISLSRRELPVISALVSIRRVQAWTAYPLYIVVCERATVAVGLQPVVQMNLIQIRTNQFFAQLMRLSGNPFQPVLVMQSAEDRSANDLTIVG
jgi:hypothetical protein